MSRSNPVRLRWLACGFSALCSIACAATGLPDSPIVKPYEPKQWIGPLKSGLRVIVREDHSTPQVTVVSTYGVGSTSDPKGVEGLAHFVEHLAFRSRPGGGPQFWDVLKRLGAADFNATTWFDFTNYYTIAHKSNLHQMMQLEAWRLAKTLDGVTPEVFKTEKEVVRGELRLGLETTVNSKIIDKLFETLYPDNHPLYRMTIGTHESLNAATLEHAKKFVADYYKPDNTTIVISGDVDTEEVKKMIGMWPPELLFGPEGPDGAAVQPRQRVGERQAPQVPPAPKTLELQKFKGPTPDHTLVLGWALPPGFRGDDTLIQFAAARLNLAINLGLGDEMFDINHDPEIQDAGAFALSVADSSSILIFATLTPGVDPGKVHGKLLDILVNAWDTSSTGRLARMQTEAIRWRAATGILFEAADPIGGALALGEYTSATGKYTLFNDKLEELAAVKEGQVSEFAYKWLTRERAAAVFFEPESTDIPRMVSGGGGGGGGGGSGGRHEIGREFAPSDADYSADMVRKTVTSPGLASFPKHKLANGLELFVVRNTGAPVAQIGLRLRGGMATTRPVGVAALANSLSKSMCPDHGDLFPVGGRIFDGTGMAFSDTDVAVLSGNLPNGIAVLSDQVRCREADEETFFLLSRIIERQQKVQEQQEKRPEYIAGKRFYSLLYPDHPFGQARFFNPLTLRDLRREEAQAFLQSHYRPGNGALVIYGDVEVEEAKKEAEKYLNLWTGGGSGNMDPPPAPPGPTRRQIFLVDRPKATQSQVIVGCRLTDMKPELMPAYDVLGELARERAWLLREEWGATYGVGAGVGRMVGGSAELTFQGAIVAPQTGRAVTRLLGIVAELGSGTIEQRFFETKRWDTGRIFMSEFALPGTHASAILQAFAYRWPLDAYDKYPENLANTTPATLKEIMAPCVGKELVAIVGDAAQLKPQLEKEGLKLEQ